jgi:hypothetical protein
MTGRIDSYLRNYMPCNYAYELPLPKLGYRYALNMVSTR